MVNLRPTRRTAPWLMQKDLEERNPYLSFAKTGVVYLICAVAYFAGAIDSVWAQDQQEQEARQLFVEAYVAGRPCREVIVAMVFDLNAGVEAELPFQDCKDALFGISQIEEVLFTTYADTEAAFELAKIGAWSEAYRVTIAMEPAWSDLLAIRETLDLLERIAALLGFPAEPPVQQMQLSISEIDAFRAQIERCWSVPSGANAENLVVTLRIFLNPDSTLAESPGIVDQARLSQPGQEFFRAIAESAVLAVERCAPYGMLPVEKDELWREVELKFDPVMMLRNN